jgi:hypothetical protein
VSGKAYGMSSQGPRPRRPGRFRSRFLHSGENDVIPGAKGELGVEAGTVRRGVGLVKRGAGHRLGGSAVFVSDLAEEEERAGHEGQTKQGERQSGHVVRVCHIIGRRCR